MSEVLKVDVWSDIACPWCYIGKRRFEEGLKRYIAAGGDRDIEVEYHAFELAPDTPVDFDGSQVDFLVKHKGMPEDQVKGMLAHVTELARLEGLNYDFDHLIHTNTGKAHQVLDLANEQGLQLELVERLFSAHFVEGLHTGRDEDLADLAAEVGMDRQHVLEALNTGARKAAVEADIHQAAAYGISGVPFYVIDGRFGVSGAQDPDVFVNALNEASA